MRCLSIFLLSEYVCLQFVVYASLILDGLPFHGSKDFNLIDVPDKAIKQSRDLKYVSVFANLYIIDVRILHSFLRILLR